MNKQKYIVEKLKIIVIFYAFQLLVIDDAIAETVWCQKFNVGCKTQEEKDKIIMLCKEQANIKYHEELINAQLEPTIWQLDGRQSAQDYAKWRARAIYKICIDIRM